MMLVRTPYESRKTLRENFLYDWRTSKISKKTLEESTIIH